MGPLIVSLMNVLLNIAAVLILIAGGIIGATSGGQVLIETLAVDRDLEWAMRLLGAGIGFIAAMVFIILTFGMLFLLLEINNNIIRLNDRISQGPRSGA